MALRKKIDDVTTAKLFLNAVIWRPRILFQDMKSGMISCRSCTAYCKSHSAHDVL